MARGESAGAVFVTIDGDIGPLLARYAQAESVSRAAGTRMAAGLGQGLQSSYKIFDEFGNVVRSGLTQPLQEVAPVADKAAISIRGVGTAAAGSVSEIQAAGAGIRVAFGDQSIRAVERFTTSILGLGPLLQAAFPLIGALALGEMIIRVAGNFGKASEADKEFADSLKKSDDEMVSLERHAEQTNIALQRLQFGTLAGLHLEGIYSDQAAQGDVDKITQTTDRLKFLQQQLNQAQHVQAIGGSFATKILLGFDVESMKQQIAEANKAIEAGNAKVSDDAHTAALLSAEIARQKAEDAGRLRLAELANQEQADQQSTRLAQSLAEREEAIQHARHQAAIDGMADRQAATVAQAEEEVRVARQKEARINADLAANIAHRLDVIRAQGAAESLGKTPEQAAVIGVTTQGKLESNKAEAAQQSIGAHSAVVDALDRLDAAHATVSREQADQIAKYWLKTEEDLVHDTDELTRLMTEKRKAAANLSLRTGQLGIRATGAQSEGANEAAKLQTQLSYEQQITHSRAEQLQYAQQMAGFEVQAANIKAQQATAELNAAIYADRQLSDDQSKLKIAEDQLALDTAISAQKRAQLTAQMQVTAAARSTSLAGQIQGAVGAGPGSLLDAKNLVVANGIGSAVNGIASAFGRAVQGGQKLGQIFSQLGKSILGEVVQSIVKIGLQMATTALLGKSLGSAIAVAEVMSAAAVGAANAAASTAAIPIIGPALAPGVAAATFAEIAAFAALASYDKGGYIDSDQIAKVHRGEYVLTADQMAGRSPMPNLPSTGAISHSSFASANSSSSASQTNHFHVHGATDVRATVRAIAGHLKSTYPGYSPYSSA